MTTTKPPVLTDDDRMNLWQQFRDFPVDWICQYARAIEQAVLERAGADAWQPIETAPKQGMILLGRPAEGEGDDRSDAICTPGYWQEGWEDSIDDMGCDDGFVDVQHDQFSPPRTFGAEKYRTAGTQPTHWMPLPAGPGALKGTPAAAVAETERCTYCDGTGDVHGFDGEWRGVCTECDAGKQLSGNPGQVADAQPVAWMDPDETCVQDAFLWRTSPQTARYRIPVFTAQPSAQPQPSGNAGEVEALATQIKDDLQCQFDTDGITEIDSGDALIRLSEALNAVDEAAIAASKGANHG